MLVLRGRLLQQIFSENYPQFAKEHALQIRPAIPYNIDKMLRCGTEDMGFHLYQCPNCKEEKKVPHTCKSRFCTSCGVKQTDMWIERYTTLFANCEYQHVIFSPPHQFLLYFRVGRKRYFDCLYLSVSQAFFDWYSRKGYFPGGMMVLHTFGRDLKWHVHIHALITCGGLYRAQTQWLPNAFLPHLYLKDRFKKHFLENIQTIWNNEKNDTIPQPLRFLFTPAFEQKLLGEVRNKIWYVYIGDRLKNTQFVVRYIGRYTKRPAIAESRILSYDGKTVAFTYKEHRMTEKATLILPVFDFIERLILHIPDKNFRIIRYFGFYANRVRGKLLPKVFLLLSQDYPAAKEKLASLGSWWREHMKRFTRLDPLVCPTCLIPFQLISMVYCYRRDTYG